MADSIAPREGDFFIRRFTGSQAITRGTVMPTVFSHSKPGRPSITFLAHQLRNERAIRKYQRDKIIPKSGDMPGLCMIDWECSFRDMGKKAYWCEDPSDQQYGKWHFEYDPPTDEIAQELARIASYYPYLPFFKAKNIPQHDVEFQQFDSFRSNPLAQDHQFEQPLDIRLLSILIAILIFAGCIGFVSCR